MKITQIVKRIYYGLLLAVMLFTSLGLPVPVQAGVVRTREQIITRAQVWVDRRIAYNQAGFTDGYRQDCAGYVAYAWGITTPTGEAQNLYTGSLADISSPISKDQLMAGDILLNDTAVEMDNRHVVIFHKWANSAKTSYWAYELSPDFAKYRELPYPYQTGYEAEKYLPYRRNDLLVLSRLAAPANAVVTALSTTSLRVRWTDASNLESGFRVYNGDALSATVPANSTAFMLDGLKAGQHYCLRVTAYNKDGESGSSAWACGWTRLSEAGYAGGNPEMGKGARAVWNLARMLVR